MIKYFLACLFVTSCFHSKTVAQKLSINELLQFPVMSLIDIDSTMKSKNFSRWDTSADNLKFRFYGFSNDSNNVHELNYLQISIIEEFNYPEIQFQTTIKKQANNLIQQLTANGFGVRFNSTSSIKFIKDKQVFDYYVEQNHDPSITLYTFKFKPSQQKIFKSI